MITGGSQNCGIKRLLGKNSCPVAVEQAILNAMFRGNLEISYEDMEKSRERLMQGEDADIVQQRQSQEPYNQRHVTINVSVSKDQARFVIGDEGPGFDVSTVPQPGDTAVLEQERGRGLTLMQTFMDDVMFNDAGNQVTMVKRRGDSS